MQDGTTQYLHFAHAWGDDHGWLSPGRVAEKKQAAQFITTRFVTRLYDLEKQYEGCTASPDFPFSLKGYTHSASYAVLTWRMMSAYSVSTSPAHIMCGV